MRNADQTSGRHILLVEDNDFLAVDLELTLSDYGYRATIASTVSAALQCIAEQVIDAAVLDVSLGGGESAFVIADTLESADIPFVFLTGRSRRHLPPRFHHVSLHAKPYKLSELLVALEHLTSKGA